ncbi:MAG: glycosyltransferase family 4 protein, partial [Deltaproteobacteria bacterium]|nr:glycosyltransferase family 4 protein [Deltaproteobacteria bacterium]
VDIDHYALTPEPVNGHPIVLMASRMLWDKGVAEFVEAAKILKSQNLKARFVLVGDTDLANPAALTHKELEALDDSSVVEWWRWRGDMPHVFSQSNIVCLPSYREGLPKVLLEAASCGRSIVATDVPGCREIVKDGVNGLLVPPRNTHALADAIKALIEDPDRRKVMGQMGREIAAREFSDKMVIVETLALYRTMLGDLSLKAAE